MNVKGKEQTHSQQREYQPLKPDSVYAHGSIEQPSMSQILQKLRKNVNEKSSTMNQQSLSTAVDSTHLSWATPETDASKRFLGQQSQQMHQPLQQNSHNELATQFIQTQPKMTSSIEQTPSLSLFTQQISQILDNLKKRTTENKSTFQSSPKDRTETSSQALPPLQFLPQQKPQVVKWTPDAEMSREETDARDMTRTKEEVLHECSDSSVATLKQERFSYRNETILVTRLPENGESLYSACAHQLFGPFRSVSELTAIATTLHRRIVNFIRKNRDSFFLDLKKLYDEIFPNHGLDDLMVFDHCCLYLAKPGHAGVRQAMLAIASLFSKPIIILYESGGNHNRIDPLGSTVNKDSPITLFSRMKFNNHFDSVDNFLKNLNSQSIMLPTMTGKLMVATWEVDSFSIEAVRNSIDQVLAKRNIDLACIQGLKLSSGYENSTAHYTWHYAVHNSVKSIGCLVFLLKKQCSGSLQDFCFTSGNLATAVFCSKNVKLKVIGCYLPEFEQQFPDVSTVAANEKYSKICNDIEQLLQQTSPSNSILLLGQFNACIGSSDIEPREETFIGSNFLHEKSNRNGLFLKQLAVKYSLNIISLSSLPPIPPKATYKRGRPIEEDFLTLQISHILLRKNRNFGLLENFRWWEKAHSFHAIVGSLLQY